MREDGWGGEGRGRERREGKRRLEVRLEGIPHVQILDPPLS